jgi:hypothetical protein
MCPHLRHVKAKVNRAPTVNMAFDIGVDRARNVELSEENL